MKVLWRSPSSHLTPFHPSSLKSCTFGEVFSLRCPLVEVTVEKSGKEEESTTSSSSSSGTPAKAMESILKFFDFMRMSRFRGTGGRARHFETAKTFATIFVEAHTPQTEQVTRASFSGRELIARALSVGDELEWESRLGAKEEEESKVKSSARGNEKEASSPRTASRSSPSMHKRVNSPEERDLLSQLQFLEEEQKRVRAMLGQIAAKAKLEPHTDLRQRMSSCVRKLVADVDACSYLILCPGNHELDRPCQTFEEAAHVSAEQAGSSMSSSRGQAPLALVHKGNYCTLRKIDLQTSSSSEWRAFERSCAFHGKSERGKENLFVTFCNSHPRLGRVPGKAPILQGSHDSGPDAAEELGADHRVHPILRISIRHKPPFVARWKPSQRAATKAVGTPVCFAADLARNSKSPLARRRARLPLYGFGRDRQRKGG